MGSASNIPEALEQPHNMDLQLQEFMSYCSARNIHISSCIHPQYNATSGLGLRITSPVKAGTQLIHAPTESLLITSCIPRSFISDQHIRQDLTVHGLLAAWLAFGPPALLESEYGPWIKTWPSWESFRDSMPLFWQSQFLTDEGALVEVREGYRARQAQPTSLPRLRNTGIQNLSSDFSLSPVVQGWSRPYQYPHQNPLTEQVLKLRQILKILHSHRDLFGFDILSPASHKQYIKLLHMWCCVNSRCFYYIPHGMRAPADSNEAMALVPFLDLFNHSIEGSGADVKYHRRGFDVTADRDYAVGEEVFIQYGQHSNDVLWTEYGFLLDFNHHDEVNIDQIIENNERELLLTLEEASFFGQYTFTASEIGYRMQTAAWLGPGLLHPSQWSEMTRGEFDPEGLDIEKYKDLYLRMNTKLLQWLIEAKQSCERNVVELLSAQRDANKRLQYFIPDTRLLDEEESNSRDVMDGIATKRMNLCLTRWRQIYTSCIGAIQVVKDQCPQALQTFGDSVKERREIMAMTSSP